MLGYKGDLAAVPPVLEALDQGCRELVTIDREIAADVAVGLIV